MPIVSSIIAVLLAGTAGLETSAAEAPAEGDGAQRPTLRRPMQQRPDPEVFFPEPVLPPARVRPDRGATETLDAYLGPIPKEIVVAEGTSLAAMQRVARVPNTSLGFATIGGNTLTAQDVRRLRRLGPINLYLTSPIELVHIEVIESLPAVRATTVRVPPGEAPDDALAWRLTRLGPGRRHVFLDGELLPARLAPLLTLRSATLTVVLPPEGLEDPLWRALGELGVALRVKVPHDSSQAAVESLAGRDLDAVILETDGNRLRREIVGTVTELDTRITVVLDRRVTREDLRRLKGIPRLDLVVWLADGAEVPQSVTDLLLESEGVRPRPEPAGDAGGREETRR